MKKIEPTDKKILKKSERVWDSIAKPLKSLGIFEAQISKLAAAQGNVYPKISSPRVLVFCADNGVVEEGVSQSGHEVTTAVAKAISAGESNVNIFAKRAGADVECYDVGMIDNIDIPTMKNANGTANISKGPAMSKEDCVYAIEVGINAVEKAKSDGVNIIAIGEMGIGNTTTSSAIIAAITGTNPSIITGRGSGLSDAGLEKKITVIKKSIEINMPKSNDGLDVLSKLGGFDIAAMCGVCLGGAAMGIPIILDGVISQAAAMCACRIMPAVKDYLIASHVSREAAGKLVLDDLGLKAPICADMALGEGTGAVLLLSLLPSILDVYSGKHSFDSIGVDQYVPQGGSK
ncbi:MAG: nicotinate-nucleotide--dimethylbenzimidazole phosphoribosyltransferase [Bacillota bacterium]|nr:nicotinate-nucleotide--dimethylbenzimidazole phosphoribosyltransferase [Bacillota bacterium]